MLLESEAVRVRVGAPGACKHETSGLLAVVIEHAWARAVSADATPDHVSPNSRRPVAAATVRPKADGTFVRQLCVGPIDRRAKLRLIYIGTAGGPHATAASRSQRLR